METLCFITLFISFGLNLNYENLSRRNATFLSQSSTYLHRNASFAKDGFQLTKQFYCSHTATNHSKAWLQVDLGEKFSINNVKIYYRKEGNEEDDWKQYRFRQFYLDISDLPATQTTTTQRTRCYTDHTVAPDLPSNIIDIPCKHTARYVIVETTYDAPEDNIPGAMLEICEIEVYGCPINCVVNVCNKTNGRCLHGCQDGYWTSTCDSVCPTQHCSSCDRNTGHCHKCNPGFEGDLCDQCDSKHYGTNCTLNCSPYCEEGCSRETGTCYNCTEGKFGTRCNETCSQNCEGECERNSGVCFSCFDEKYGEWCKKTCGAGCVSGCEQLNGSCTCKLGWEGEKSDDCDSNRYGTYCTLNCSQYCIEGCSRKTGSCYNCTEGRYGDSCNETCGAGCVSGCDQSNGTCTSCKPGWEGDRCDVQSIQNAGNSIHPSLPFIIILPAISSISFFLVIRHCWRKQCTRQIQQSKDTEENPGNQPSDSLESPDVIYENVRGECEYQDLTPCSEPSHPSHYDQLYPSQDQTSESLELKDYRYENVRKGSEDQELDQHSEQSYYEPILFTKTSRGLDREKNNL